MNPHSVLLIDPDLDSREIYSALLGHNGYQVLVASDLDEGLSAARQVLPAVIVTELFVRTLEGWRVLDSLKSDAATAGIPIIALSAYALPDDRRRARLADVFLPKPCEVECVLREVARLCANRAKS